MLKIILKLRPKTVQIVMFLGMKIKDFTQFCVCKQNNKHMLHLLLITEDEKTHYVLIKDFNRLLLNKTKHEHRKHFCMHFLQCFSSEDVLTRRKSS